MFKRKQAWGSRKGASKRRRFSRKQVRRASKPRVARFGAGRATGIPDRVQVKLQYSGHYKPTSLNGSTVVVAYEEFKGNSIYDPWSTGSGHQPLYYTQLAALYFRWRVKASSIRVQVVDAPGALSGNVVSIVPTPGYVLSASATPGTGSSSYVPSEQPYSKNKLISFYNGTGDIKHYMTTQKIFGLHSDQMDSAYVGAQAADPTQLWYWCVSQQGIRNTNTSILTEVEDASASTSWFVNLVYYVEFFDRSYVGPSAP